MQKIRKKIRVDDVIKIVEGNNRRVISNGRLNRR